MNVHEEINDSRLNVPFMLVNDDFLAGVVDFHVRVRFLLGLVERLVLLLIVLDPQPEVVHRLVLVHVGVVGTADLHLDDVLLDQVRIVADRLDEEQLELLLLHDDLFDHLATLVGGVGCVENLFKMER